MDWWDINGGALLIASVAWLTGMILFAFKVGGRVRRLEESEAVRHRVQADLDSIAKGQTEVLARIQRLEDTDERMTDAIASLTESVGKLTELAHGNNGNLSLSRALETVAQGLAALTSRQGHTEAQIQLHEVRLARLDEMRSMFEERARDFYMRKWDPLTVQVGDILRSLSDIKDAMARQAARKETKT